ncbi:MAG: hypothetical protein WC683_10300 [bacterium]
MASQNPKNKAVNFRITEDLDEAIYEFQDSNSIRTYSEAVRTLLELALVQVAQNPNAAQRLAASATARRAAHERAAMEASLSAVADSTDLYRMTGDERHLRKIIELTAPYPHAPLHHDIAVAITALGANGSTP